MVRLFLTRYWSQSPFGLFLLPVLFIPPFPLLFSVHPLETCIRFLGFLGEQRRIVTVRLTDEVS